MLDRHKLIATIPFVRTREDLDVLLSELVRSKPLRPGPTELIEALHALTLSPEFLGSVFDMDRTLPAKERSVLNWWVAAVAERQMRWVEAYDRYERAIAGLHSEDEIARALIRTSVQLQDPAKLTASINRRHSFAHDIRRWRFLMLGDHIQFVDTPRCSNIILHSLLSGAYERNERQLVMHTLSAGDRVIEVGGGIGAVSTCIASIVGSGQLKVFEANPGLLPIASATLAANGFDVPISQGILEAAVARGTTCSRRFSVSSEFWASSRIDTGATLEEIDVPCFCLEDCIRDHNANVLCVDIEGGEYELLHEADLSSIQKIIVELHPQFIGLEKCSTLLNGILNRGFIFDPQAASRGVHYFHKG